MITFVVKGGISIKQTNHITESEWQVMRVIWSKVPSTSSHIIEMLSESTDWSPTTIKTLIGRLVKKNIISFEAVGRTFYYTPNITEEECIENEIQLLIKRIYGDKLNKETSHFLFYGCNIKEYNDLLAETLETNFERITNNLQFQFQGQVTVYVHPNLQRLHSALGVRNGPEWLRAGWTWGILHIVPSEYFTDLQPDKAAVHVLAEIIIQKINSSIPFWLSQGIAGYESKWIDQSQINMILSDKIVKKELPSFMDLSSELTLFGDNYGYVYTYSIVEFIVNRYGYTKLNMLVKESHNFKKVFGCSDHEFNLDWHRFLNEKYKKEE